jgi:hypothetical protein
MNPIGLISRLKIIAVLEATLYLIGGIADVFVDMTLIRDLVFHSVFFHICVFIVCWIMAPLVARFVDV